jgi:hypothetical protein
MPTQPVPLITMIERNTNDIDEIYELLKHVDAHLDAHDARFDAMDSRFDAMDSRLDAMDGRLFEILSILRPGDAS